MGLKKTCTQYIHNSRIHLWDYGVQSKVSCNRKTWSLVPKPYQHALCATYTSTKTERERERASEGGGGERERHVLREETLLWSMKSIHKYTEWSTAVPFWSPHTRFSSPFIFFAVSCLTSSLKTASLDALAGNLWPRDNGIITDVCTGKETEIWLSI